MSAPFKYFLLFCSTFILSGSCQKNIPPQTGIIKLTFRNMVNTAAMVLDSTTYSNPFGETFTITKFKYYVSNVQLTGAGATVTEKES